MNLKVRKYPFSVIKADSILLFCLFIMVFRAIPGTAADKVLFKAHTFSSEQHVEEQGWTHWSPREEISPEFSVADQPSIDGTGSLAISGVSNSATYGCWRKLVKGIESGGYCRFEASYCTRRISHPERCVIAMLDWRDGNGRRVGQPEYVPDMPEENGWRKAGAVFQAPDNAESVSIELYLRFTAQGTVWWDSIVLETAEKPAERIVRIGTVNCFPRNLSTAAESVEEFCKIGEEAGKEGCDILCMGEVINLVGIHGGAYIDSAEPIPGPSTERLGRLAKKWNMYIVAGLEERDGQAIYCTAVLIDRQGKVAGKYRKVTIPREELEGGVTPGDSFPVFDTDFGRIGMMICFDLQYVEPARALALQSAEIIFLPVWGGNPKLPPARCIENQVYMAVSGYDIASNIYDPWGNLIAAADKRPGYAIAAVDLSQPHPDRWLGNMRHRMFKEIRTDIPMPDISK